VEREAPRKVIQFPETPPRYLYGHTILEIDEKIRRDKGPLCAVPAVRDSNGQAIIPGEFYKVTPEGIWRLP